MGGAMKKGGDYGKYSVLLCSEDSTIQHFDAL
jgi:hypothetical protein